MKPNTELVLVEAVSMFRIRYVVEVPQGKASYALDTVVCNEAVEFSQEHLGENIVSHRIVSEKEAISLCNKDNDYAKSWDSSRKAEVFFTPWKE